MTVINLRFAACAVCFLLVTNGASAFEPDTGFDYFQDEENLVEQLAKRRSHWKHCEIPLHGEFVLSVTTELHLQAVGYEILNKIEKAIDLRSRELEEIFRGKEDRELLMECIRHELTFSESISSLISEAPDLLISYAGPYQYPTGSAPQIRRITETLMDYKKDQLILGLTVSEGEIKKKFKQILSDERRRERRVQAIRQIINSYRIFEIISKKQVPFLSTYFSQIAAVFGKLLDAEVTHERILETQEEIAHFEDVLRQKLNASSEEFKKSTPTSKSEIGYFMNKLPIQILSAASIPITETQKEN